MRRFIHVQTLFDEACDLDFGYVAVDCDTGNICYFSHFDKSGTYNTSEIYPFDPNNVDGDLAWHMARSGYQVDQISSEIHPEIVEYLSKSITAHRDYNIKNSYRIDILDFNAKHLHVVYTPSYLAVNREAASMYSPVENRLDLYSNKLEYEDASKRKKMQEKSNILHEIGHMKVSTYEIKDNKLFIRTGFFSSEATLEPIVLRSGDIFYKIKDAAKKGINLEKKALEEIINDTECASIFSTFMRTYPNIGDSLNDLCDNVLPKLRHDDDAFLAYCEYLEEIVGSKDAVVEINGLIKDALFGRNRQVDERKALKLIRQFKEKRVI
ncbi:MAG: hypothetical protein OSJ70_04050 [Bacilli bacterium]|nr:hypothetical protein [Bacilli bacterium]